jgi:DNA-binding FrmR family transcriptional regulator
VVKPSDDDLVHIETVMKYIQLRAAEGAAPQPMEGQMLQQHLAEHVTQLKTKDSKAGTQIEKDLNEFFEQAAQAANEQQQAAELNGEATTTEVENAPGVQQDQRIPAAAGVG